MHQEDVFPAKAGIFFVVSRFQGDVWDSNLQYVLYKNEIECYSKPINPDGSAAITSGLSSSTFSE